MKPMTLVGELKVTDISSYKSNDEDAPINHIGFYVFDDNDGIGVSSRTFHRWVSEVPHGKFKVTIEPIQE